MMAKMIAIEQNTTTPAALLPTMIPMVTAEGEEPLLICSCCLADVELVGWLIAIEEDEKPVDKDVEVVAEEAVVITGEVVPDKALPVVGVAELVQFSSTLN